MPLLNRAPPDAVALETTLLVHGVPRADAPALAVRLGEVVAANGASPAFVGVVRGTPTVGLTPGEIRSLLDAPDVPKANTANLGVLIHRRSHGATTVSATLELAAAAGVRVFATGGIGGLHRGYADRFDASADLAALARFPVAVVASGVKSFLDVPGTRETLETLGVPVIGFRTDAFPAFYQRASDAGVDARFDDEADLAAFLAGELARAPRAVLVCNPIPAPAELDPRDWSRWLDDATRAAQDAGITGRALTPFLLARVHELSGGATLRANLALVEDNARLAARLRHLMPRS